MPVIMSGFGHVLLNGTATLAVSGQGTWLVHPSEGLTVAAPRRFLIGAISSALWRLRLIALLNGWNAQIKNDLRNLYRPICPVRSIFVSGMTFDGAASTVIAGKLGPRPEILAICINF